MSGGRFYVCVPPFTWIIWPLMKAPLSEANSDTVAAISSGSPRRPTGILEAWALICAVIAGSSWSERIGPGDICVTGDIPLAARCIEAGGGALKHNGEAFTKANIGNALAMRDLMADLRSANPLGAGGGAKLFGKADRSRFLESLERMIRAAGRPG